MPILIRRNLSDGTAHKPLIITSDTTQRHNNGQNRLPLHRRLMQRQSRPGRLGRINALRQPRKRAFRRRSANHQQPHGADRRHRRTEIPQTTLHRHHLHRLAIRQKRHGKLDTRRRFGKPWRGAVFLIAAPTRKCRLKPLISFRRHFCHILLIPQLTVHPPAWVKS